jgi:hypothetical protein
VQAGQGLLHQESSCKWPATLPRPGL